MNNIVHRARVVLIETGKQLPFVLCFVVAISYAECAYALYFEQFIVFDDCVYLKKPISWFFGSLFEYDKQILALIGVITLAIRTCVWNKLATLYLAAQLFEKYYFQSHELANHKLYYLVSAVNIVVCLFFVLKGLQRLTKH